MGRKLAAEVVGLSALGMADKMARNNSVLSSPVFTQSYNSLHNSLEIIGFANKIFNVAISKPKHPGEADTFILLTHARSSSTVNGSLRISQYS